MYEYTTSDEERDEEREIFGLSEHSSDYDSDDVVSIGYESDPEYVFYPNLKMHCTNATAQRYVCRLAVCRYSFSSHVLNIDLKYMDHVASCSKCKGKGKQNHHQFDATKHWIIDSGASIHFTYSKSDFVDYESLEEKIPVQQAGPQPIYIEGKGTILL